MNPSPSSQQHNDRNGTVVFVLVHLAGLAALATGFSWFALAAFLFLYYLRMFFITGGYHRYFAHRTYKTSRWFQAVLAFGGGMSAQKGALWWGGHHRSHHKYSDTQRDIHSAKLKGFYWSHVGWVLSDQYLETPWENLKDWAQYPELVFLNKEHWIPPVFLAVSLFGLGSYLAVAAPGLHTNGPQLLFWGFFLSTTFLYHGTFFINSLSHVFGRQRYDTNDESRNSFSLSVLTLGEGWHNNHHKYPFSERQGFFWWEMDITHYLLKALSWVGLVWDLQSPPARAYNKANFTKHPGPILRWPDKRQLRMRNSE